MRGSNFGQKMSLEWKFMEMEGGGVETDDSAAL